MRSSTSPRPRIVLAAVLGLTGLTGCSDNGAEAGASASRTPIASPTVKPSATASTMPDSGVDLTCPAPAPDDVRLVSDHDVPLDEGHGVVHTIPHGQIVTVVEGHRIWLVVACGRYHVGRVRAADFRDLDADD